MKVEISKPVTKRLYTYKTITLKSKSLKDWDLVRVWNGLDVVKFEDTISISIRK